MNDATSGSELVATSPDPRPLGNALLQRYAGSLLGVFGTPQRVLTHGEGSFVYDADGNRYLDLLGGIAVNSLGHGHPALVQAIAEQAAQAIHVCNFFTSPPQIELAEMILRVAQVPSGSAVFFTNSGTEATEAAVKLARRTGRIGMLAAEDAFHGRSTGALALTAKAAYREPFDPLIPGVLRVRYNDEVALKQAFTDAADRADRDRIGAIFLEPIQGEAGVIPAEPGYLRAARELATEYDALLILDEVQTGVGRTGSWFAFQQAGIMPDAFTLAKGLGGGMPIGALVTVGPRATQLLTAGQHGTTFGGNPLACAAGLAVLRTIEHDDVLARVTRTGGHLVDRLLALGDPRITGVRGRGLLLGVALTEAIAPMVVEAGLDAGFIVNAPNPQTIRLAPNLLISPEEADMFIEALPGLLDRAIAAAGDRPETADAAQLPTRDEPETPS